MSSFEDLLESPYEKLQEEVSSPTPATRKPFLPLPAGSRLSDLVVTSSVRELLPTRRPSLRCAEASPLGLHVLATDSWGKAGEYTGEA